MTAPTLALNWSEARTRAETYARSGGIDEILPHLKADHWSHRYAEGQLGGYRPANGLHLSWRVHEWLHHHPALAYAGGWHLRTGDDPATSPVWLARPWPGWWLIDDAPTDGGPHLLVPYPEELAEPSLPPFVVA